ncbi:MAG: hypothetical protein AB1898_13460 [Acidobacteriota bacterium]
MTAITPVEMRLAGKLAGVLVSVTGLTLLMQRMIVGVLACRRVATMALNLEVFSAEWIFGFAMRFSGEGGGLESTFSVTAGAISPVGSASKLALVVILMTIQAPLVSEVRFELCGRVALRTPDIAMSLAQGEGRLIVIEISRDFDATPPGCTMTALATRCEGTAMRVRVTRGATGKRQSGVTNRPVTGAGSRMTFLTSNLSMKPGQRKSRELMIETGRRTPPLQAMALRTLQAQLPPMLVHVTACALRRQSQPRSFQTSSSQLQARLHRNVSRVMTFFTGCRGVSPLERIAGLAVIEVLFHGWPADD